MLSNITSHQTIQKAQTKSLVEDYVAWRVAKAGYHTWHQANKVDLKENTRNKLCTAMRHLAYKFEKVQAVSYTNDHLELTAFNCRDTFLAVISELFDLTDIKTEVDIDCKLDVEKLPCGFSCDWGRIIGLFALAGGLAVQCLDEQASGLIYSLIEIQVEFLSYDKRIFGWIESQGGWSSFLEYFDERYNLIKLEDIDLPIENLNNEITRNNYFFKLADSGGGGERIGEFYLSAVQEQCRSFFGKVSRYAGVAVGSIGVLALGAVYMKKK